jgi:hypothetical protein
MLTGRPLTSERLDRLDVVQSDPHPAAVGGWFQGKRRVVGIVVVLALVVGLTVVGYQRAYGRLVHGYDSGPVYTGSGTKTGFPVDLGQPFTYGVITVSNRTGRTAVLTGVRVKPSLPASMEILEVKVVGPNRKTAVVGTGRQYPPPELAPHLRPLKGARVPPKNTSEGYGGVEIVFGLKVIRPGIFGFRQVELDYRIGSKPYTALLEDGFVACAPRAVYPRCSTERFFKSRS